MSFRPDIGTMPADALRALAPSGTLRAGINLSNFLLVSSRAPDGGPVGVSPDMARAIAAWHSNTSPIPTPACWRMPRRATNGTSR